MLRRLLGTCLPPLALALTLFHAREAEARPSLEVSSTIGGAESTEYLVRVSNPDLTEDSGVLELRRYGDRVFARTPFSVPAKATRYFRIPGGRGQLAAAVAITSEGTVHANERFNGGSGLVVFDIPPRDSQRLQDLRVHSTNATISIAHATFDDTTNQPVLTRRAAVYDGVALVMVPSSMFIGLPTAEREALTTWVRTGGAMAMSLTNESDLAQLADVVGAGGERLRPAVFGKSAELGLGHIYMLPMDPWSADAPGDITSQEHLARLIELRPEANHFFGEPWNDAPPASLDPNQGYRSVMALAGVLLVLQALITAFVFRRLAVGRGMGAAYRFAFASSALTFGAVIGLGIYAKGGFGARVREVSFVDIASGETVAWVERKRTFFASDTRTVDVTAQDPANDLSSHDDTTVFGVDAKGADVLGEVSVHPWVTTAVNEHGTTTLGGGITLGSSRGLVVVHNASGSVLRNVFVSTPEGMCFDFGSIANGEEKTGGSPHSCSDLGPGWKDYNGSYEDRLDRYFPVRHPTLFGQIEDTRTPVPGFRVEKQTTVVRVSGGDS